MRWIATLARRVLGGTSRRVQEERERGEAGSAPAGSIMVVRQGKPPDTPGLEEWIRAFDLDKEKGRLTEENARLRRELMARNTQLDRAREEYAESARARPIAERTLRDVFDGDMELIATLLPNLEFVRDSGEVLRNRLRNRLPALSLLRELSTRPGLVKGTRVEGAPEWKEHQHFQTGEGDNGRMYFRCRGERCSVLVSFKAHQEADIQYLRTIQR